MHRSQQEIYAQGEERVFKKPNSRTDLTVDGELVVRQQAVGLFEEEVPANEFLEPPVLTTYKLICTLTL